MKKFGLGARVHRIAAHKIYSMVEYSNMVYFVKEKGDPGWETAAKTTA